MEGRVLWAQRFLNRNFDWSTALFADETVFNTDGPAFRAKMWQDTRDPPTTLVQSGARSQAIHIWGAFSTDFVPDLVVLPHPLDSKAYCDALAQALLTSNSFQKYILFHDRHTAHHSKLTNQWLDDHSVTAELFPPKCADLNPIENLWAQLSRKVYPQNKTYANTHQLLCAIRAAWREIQTDKAVREEYVRSMTGRLHEVIKSKGRWTKH
jgi:transposase